MADEHIELNVLNVGQGSFVFVEVYSSVSILTNTLLIDCGSLASPYGEKKGAINYVYGKLMSMPAPTIDALIVSHPDADHVNMLVPLFKKFAGNLAVKMIRYGGKESWYGSLFDTIKAAVNNTPVGGGFTVKESQLLTDGSWAPLWSENGVTLTTVMANTPSTRAERLKAGQSIDTITGKPSGDRVNTMSVVCGVIFGEKIFVATGDATKKTIFEINSVLKDITLTNDTYGLTLPHHGSRGTTLGMGKPSAKASVTNLAAVKTFSNAFSADTAVASASNTQYHHPSLTVMDIFQKDCWPIPYYYDDTLFRYYKTKLHFITAYADDDSYIPGSKYCSFMTTTNLYTTLYCVPSFLRRRWQSSSYPPLRFLKAKKPLPDTATFPLGQSWAYSVTESVGDYIVTLDPFSYTSAVPTASVALPEPSAAPAVTRRINAPAADTSAPAFSRSFGRRVA